MKAEFYYNKHKYTVIVYNVESSKELRIRNDRGEVLAVEQGKKVGLQGKRRENSKEVDVSQPHFYNLIKVALAAIEIAEKNQLIIEKDRITDRKDEQISNLNQQLNILKQTHNLSFEQKQKLIKLQNSLKEQGHIIEVQKQLITKLEDDLNQLPQILPFESIEKKVRDEIGEEVWKYLHPSSQRDLCNAYRYYQLIESEEFADQVADYSDAGHPLGIVAEREIVAPFFEELYKFLSTKPNQVNLAAGVNPEIGGITLKLEGEYTLGDLRILISEQWETFRKNALKQEKLLNENNLYCKIDRSYKVSQTERHLVEQFFQQWQHPLS